MSPASRPDVALEPLDDDASHYTKHGRTFGPSLPPPTANQDEIDVNDSSSDEDDYGPAPPTASRHSVGTGASSHGPTSVGEARMAAAAAAAASMQPQRDDWMLAPPSQDGFRVTDPTKLKARKFASGRSVRGGDGGGRGEVSSIWTETPEQKARRIADRVLGRAAADSVPGATAGQGDGGRRPARGEGEDEERVKRYTEETRGKSLYREHQERRKDSTAPGTGGGKRPGARDDEEEDDPSKRAFDKEKDMGLGIKISGSQRKELLNRAAEFGGRFQKGSYL